MEVATSVQSLEKGPVLPALVEARTWNLLSFVPKGMEVNIVGSGVLIAPRVISTLVIGDRWDRRGLNHFEDIVGDDAVCPPHRKPERKRSSWRFRKRIEINLPIVV